MDLLSNVNIDKINAAIKEAIQTKKEISSLKKEVFQMSKDAIELAESGKFAAAEAVLYASERKINRIKSYLRTSIISLHFQSDLLYSVEKEYCEAVIVCYVMTNREILDLREPPAEMIVIGGGVIGLEMACYYSTVGSHVTVIEMLDHIAGPTDTEISGILMKNYQKLGIDFKLGCKVTAVKDGKVCYEENGKPAEVAADKVLCSIGRRAVTEGFGLEKLGVYVDRGIKTDEQMRTNVAGVYAAGDVNGVSMLAHTAYREGEVAVNTILGKKDRMRYNAIPSVIYTNPEVGAVGETEASAKAKGLDVEVVKLPMVYSGRYLAENEGGNGIVKVVVDKKYHRVLGVHMIANYAAEIIYGAALMIETEMCIDNLKEIVFPHPTVCEVIREALFDVK